MKEFLTQPKVVAFLAVWLAIFLLCSILSGVAYSIEDTLAPSNPQENTSKPVNTKKPTETTPSPELPETQEPDSPTVDYYKDLVYSASNSNYLIYLDAGHGWSDPGVVVTPTGERCDSITHADHNKCINEKDINLAITKKLKTALEKMGYIVGETRPGDAESDCPVELSQYGMFNVQRRVSYINSKNPDYCISIHCNSLDNDSVTHGTRLYHHTNRPASQQLAEQMKTTLIENMDLKVNRYDYLNFAITRDATMPAILIETGFMTNLDDLSNLCDPDWQARFACAIALGMDAYIHAGN